MTTTRRGFDAGEPMVAALDAQVRAAGSGKEGPAAQVSALWTPEKRAEWLATVKDAASWRAVREAERESDRENRERIRRSFQENPIRATLP